MMLSLNLSCSPFLELLRVVIGLVELLHVLSKEGDIAPTWQRQEGYRQKSPCL
jgi:hypothetical protein